MDTVSTGALSVYPAISDLKSQIGAVRIEHQFYELGQACAIAADIAIKQEIAVQDVPYDTLKEQLLARGAKLDASKVGMPSFPDEEELLN